MWYEINVSLNGKHFFATDKRSITDIDTLKNIYKIFAEKFPKSENYNLIITKMFEFGNIVDPDDIKN